MLEKNLKKAISLWLFTKWEDYVHDRDETIDDHGRDEIRMSDRDSEHSPEKHEWYDIGSISTLIVRREEECESEDSDSPVDLRESPTRETERDEPDRDIGNRCDIDPAESELDTIPQERMRCASMMETILQEPEDHDHHDERCPDPDISPWDEPDSCERNR